MKKKKIKSIGNRYNKGKLRWRNMPLFILRPLVEVGSKAEKHKNNPKGKYETFNFLNGLYINDNLDSAKRHQDSFEDPDQPDIDPETGVSHAVHAAWNLLVADYFRRTRPDLDDRYKTQLKKKKKK